MKGVVDSKQTGFWGPGHCTYFERYICRGQLSSGPGMGGDREADLQRQRRGVLGEAAQRGARRRGRRRRQRAERRRERHAGALLRQRLRRRRAAKLRRHALHQAHPTLFRRHARCMWLCRRAHVFIHPRRHLTTPAKPVRTLGASLWEACRSSGLTRRECGVAHCRSLLC